jgi:tight adherence protein C
MSPPEPERRLHRAGFTQAGARLGLVVARIFSAAIFTALAGAIVVSMQPESLPGAESGSPLPRVFFVLVGTAFGAVLPGFIIGGMIARRQMRMAVAVADVVDLLVLCVESGLGLDTALRRVTVGIRELCPELATELAVVNADLQAGRHRAEVFRELHERTGVDELRTLTELIMEVDTLGTSIGEALRKHADSMRISRRQKAHQKAATLPAKMSAVLVIFFLVPLLIVIIGPIGIRIGEAFDEMDKPAGAPSADASGAPAAPPSAAPSPGR